MSVQSGVVYKEFDISQIISADGNLPAAIVFASSRGPAYTRVLSTTTTEFTQVFGNPDPSVSFGHYAALAYLAQGNLLWSVRATGAGANYGCLLLQKKAADPIPTLQNVSTTTPTLYNFGTSVNGSVSAAENIALFYPLGPGSFSSTWSMSIVSANILMPTGLAAAAASSGGVLAAATYSYAITATNSYGETVATALATAVVASGTSNKITLTWNAVPGATGYNIYGRIASVGVVQFLASVTSSQTSYVDTGLDTPATASPQPTVSSVVASNLFTVSVFDSAVSTVNAVEQFTVTLLDSTDAFGKQQRIETVINEQSRYIRVLSNMTVVGTAPTVSPINGTAFPAGTSGVAVTDTDIINGWNLFLDREQVAVRVLINGGYSTPAVQQNMVAIAEKRQDCMAFLDIPSTKQTAIAALTYRNTTLNVNSSRAAIFAQDLYITDTYNGRQMYVPPSGHMAALLVRSAYQTAEWYPFAGLNRGVLDVVGARYQYSDGDRELLKLAQINYVRNFPGQGLALWEQVTMQSKLSGLSWISVRMTVDSIQLAARRFAFYSVHELNDDITGRQLVSGISDFLQSIVNQRGLQEFLVVSDSRNNSAQTIGTGKRKVAIFMKPTLPIDQIELDGIITKQDAIFTELIKQF